MEGAVHYRPFKTHAALVCSRLVCRPGGDRFPFVLAGYTNTCRTVSSRLLPVCAPFYSLPCGQEPAAHALPASPNVFLSRQPTILDRCTVSALPAGQHCGMPGDRCRRGRRHWRWATAAAAGVRWDDRHVFAYTAPPHYRTYAAACARCALACRLCRLLRIPAYKPHRASPRITASTTAHRPFDASRVVADVPGCGWLDVVFSVRQPGRRRAVRGNTLYRASVQRLFNIALPVRLCWCDRKIRGCCPSAAGAMVLRAFTVSMKQRRST